MLNFDTTNSTIPPAITVAAGYIATAEARLDSANAEMADAEAMDRQLRGRIAALTDERTSIVQRRAGGRHEYSDAARLALIAADLEGLSSIAAEAEAALAAARSKMEGEQRLAVQARAHLARAEDEATLAALTEHARKLDALLVASLAEARQVYMRLGIGKPPFAPSPALVLEIRKVAAAHGLL